MIRVIMGIILFFCGYLSPAYGEVVHTNGLSICSIIINELSEGKISLEEAKEISVAIAEAGNKHYGKVTCGDMWLYMAIVHIESGFRNNIVNYLNCRGMFQVHAPSWARKFGLKYGDLLDLKTNADCGIRIYKYYQDIYRTTIPTLSAYNSDDPYAARGYARSVLQVRQRIKKRYAQLYKAFNDKQLTSLEQEAH